MQTPNSNTTDYDVIIVGAGPAGCATALNLQGSGLRVLILDKESFPRDKICGDAISPDVVNQLSMLPTAPIHAFHALDKKIRCKGVRFISPNYSVADLSLNSKGEIEGYVSTRETFDNMLFRHVEAAEVCDIEQGVLVKHIEKHPKLVSLQLKDGRTLSCRMIVGADGANSVVARKLGGAKVDRNHHCAGLRQYWEGVTGFSDDNSIELHFYHELLPGYFWMFPLPDGKANVGLGILSSKIDHKKLNLKQMLQEIIETHPNVKERFVRARPLESIQGFGLPLGSRKRSISGDHYLLTGDAASLINPLSGEGIANAIRSGRVAADHIRSAFEVGQFDAAFNRGYDREIYRRVWSELRANYWIQRLMRNPRVCNFIVRRAIGNPSIQRLVLSGFNIEKWTMASVFPKRQKI